MVESFVPAANGLIVEVLRSAPAPVEELGPFWDCKAVSGAKSDHGYCLPGEDCLIPDAWLRPIRNQDGEDGILRIAGKPQKEIA